MKKIKVLLSALAMVAAMAFVSCGGGAGDDPTGGKSGSGAVEEALVFDITASYDNYIVFDEAVPEGTGYTKANVIAKFESTTGNSGKLQLMNEDNSAQASATIDIGTDYATLSVACLAGATYTAWVDGKAVTKDCVDTAAKVQGFIQDSGYQPVAGKIYIKKAWLSGEGKEDLVLFEYTAE